jgi:hypothetical protein
MSRACDFRVSSFLGFSGAGDCCAQFTVFCVVSCGGLCFRVSSFPGFSGAGDCCAQFTVLCAVSCWGLVFLGFQAF